MSSRNQSSMNISSAPKYSAPRSGSLLPLIRKAFFVPAIAFGAIALTSGSVLVADRTVTRRLRHNREILNLARSTEKLTIDRETAIRGYIISGDRRSLTREIAARRELPLLLDSLRLATSTDPAQDARVAALVAAIARWDREFAQPILSGAIAQADAATTAGIAGKDLFDAIRGSSGEIISAETATYDARHKRLEVLRHMGTAAAFVELAAILLLMLRFRDDMLGQAGEVLKSRDEIARQRQLLETRTAQLEQSNRALKQFAVVASHDLQEPLRKVRAFGDILLTECGPSLPEHGKDYAARMVNAATRMQTLVSDLLVYAGVTTRGRVLDDVNLEAICAEAIADIGMAVPGQTEIDVGPLPTIRADATQMRQLFQNLIGNAFKYGRTGEPLRIVVSSRQITENGDGGPARGFVEIRVEDNGIGFDPKYKAVIFEPFRRLHSSDSPYKGTGIGLAICQAIAERHGGTITASGIPGSGSTFSVRLPESPSAEA